MKKNLLLVVTGLSVLGSMTATYADETTTVAVTANTSTSTSVSPERLALQEKIRLLREKNKDMHNTSKESRKEFRTENKDDLKENRKSLTPEQLAEIEKAHTERQEYIASLSGMTLEQKSQYMSGMEDKIRSEIEKKYQNASGALVQKRMDVYEQNAARRAEMMTNQLEIRTARGTLRVSEVDTMIAKITAELPNLSTEKKTKLAGKIDERIAKIQANKRLPDVSKTEIVTKLTALRNEVVK